MTFPAVWTPARDAKLADLFVHRYLLEEIAARLAEGEWRPTCGTIQNRARYLGIKRPDDVKQAFARKSGEKNSLASGWTPERVLELTKLHLRGLSCAQIAKQLGGGLSRNAVIGKVSRLGLAVDARRPPSAPPVRASRPRPDSALGPKPAGHAFINQGRVLLGCADAPMPKLREVPNTTHAKHWTERRFGECSWPIGEGADLKSCCAPVARGAWCEAHADIGFTTPKTSAKDFVRGCRKWVA